jgi:hypothetical protein
MIISRKRKMAIGLLLTFAIALSMGISALAASVTLSVARVEQAKDNWCWAASAEMIGKYKFSTATKTQWDVVTDRKGAGYPDVTGDASDVSAGISLVTNNNYSASYGSTRTFAKHKEYIDDGNPLACRMGWLNASGNLNGNGHYLVVSAYESTTSVSKIKLIDPSAGNSSASYNYSDLVAGCTIQSGTGKYTHSVWLT